MTEFQRLIKSRAIICAVIIVILVSCLSLATIYKSLNAQPESWYPLVENADSNLREDEIIRGWALLNKDSFLIGELANYQIRILWRNDKINPDIETFKNGVGFFPFNRKEVSERTTIISGNITEYILTFILQAVDVEPAQSYSLSSPTIYFTSREDDSGELNSYRIDPPQVHIGEYYPQNVSRIPLLELKGKINDPVELRSGLMALAGLILLVLTMGLFWYFGRMRRVEILSEPEKLWRRFQELKNRDTDPRSFLTQSELIFTDLLVYKLEMNPSEFWTGKSCEDMKWDGIIEQARGIFFQNYLKTEPDSSLVDQITTILDEIFSKSVEEEVLKIEVLPSWPERLARQPVLVSFGIINLLLSGVLFTLSFDPETWSAAEVNEYNRIVDYLNSDGYVEEKYEEITNFAEAAENERVKAIAYYNAGTFAASPELVGQDIYQQQALMEVMFQEQRVFLDALLHSLAMEDPFLLIGMIRDGIRFMTLGEASLKFAVRLNPEDVDYRRNLELIQKRRDAYAETVAELLQEGEESQGMGEMQRQSLMDLEQFMQMEMPEEFAELKEGKDDKDYFILEGF